jgi:hypothetical protein
MSAEREAAYATIAAATYGGALPAGHRAWLEAQSDEMVIGIADRFHPTAAQYLAEIGAKGGKAKSKAKTKAAKANGKKGGRPRKAPKSETPSEPANAQAVPNGERDAPPTR